MNDTLLLLKHFIKSPKEVGAISPSSSYLQKEILSNVRFKEAKTIVELGPGLGIITKGIVQRANKNAKIICLEINKKFCKELELKFHDKRLEILEEKAEKLVSVLKGKGIKKVDYIISGLPFRNFSRRQQLKILGQITKVLSKDGKFVLFQYTNGLRETLEEHFTQIKRAFVAFNMPPAFVYTCGRKK